MRPAPVRKTIDRLKRDGLVETTRMVMGHLDEPLPLGYSPAGVVADCMHHGEIPTSAAICCQHLSTFYICPTFMQSFDKGRAVSPTKGAAA